MAVKIQPSTPSKKLADFRRWWTKLSANSLGEK
jgi:hypothetical protein